MKYDKFYFEKNIRKHGVEICFELFKALCAVTCAFITQDIVLTLIYTIGISAFDLFVKFTDGTFLEKAMNYLFKHAALKYFVFIIFIIIACLPTAACLPGSNNLSDLLIRRSHNLVPNLMGAFIVCSFINYLSKLDTDEILYALSRFKKIFLDVFVRAGFIIAFLNAVNFTASGKSNLAEITNGIHLSVVVFFGVLMLGTFAFWIICNNHFKPDRIVIYPARALLWCGLFLFSCAFFPIHFSNAPNDWLLLFFNAVTAVIVAWSFLAFIRRKTDNKIKNSLWIELITFTVCVLGIVIYSISHIDTIEKNNIITQLISGIIILFSVVFLLYIIDYLQKKNINHENTHTNVKKLKNELAERQARYKKSLKNGLKSDHYEREAIMDLIKMAELKSNIKMLEHLQATNPVSPDKPVRLSNKQSL